MHEYLYSVRIYGVLLPMKLHAENRSGSLDLIQRRAPHCAGRVHPPKKRPSFFEVV